MRPGIPDSTLERFQSYFSQTEDAARERVTGALDAFFAAASAGLLLANEDLYCVQVNDVMAATTGRALLDHPGRHLGELLPPSVVERLQDVVREGQELDKVPFELRGRSYAGTFFPVYADREITGLGGIVIDVSEHKRLETELRAAIELRERVLAVVSHDLRNPLGTIELAIATMPQSVLADRDAARRIDIVRRATKMMETLICDLLDIATIQAGTLALRREELEPGSLVREVVELHKPLADEKGLFLVDDSDLEGLRVSCDRDRVLQVLGNLLGNAIKFCTKGDQISISGCASDDALELEVSDTGPGIPADDVPHLFQPYWSTMRGRQRGTGLGLFICKAIVDAHGGQLTVSSSLGAGTTFRIVLPRH